MEVPSLITELKTPKVLWYQNGISVIIRIMLTDIKDYFLQVDYDSLRFSTQHEGNNYYLWLNLYGTVIPQQTINQDKGREITIKLAKAHKWMDWLRLHREQTRDPMIRPDLENSIREDVPVIQNDVPPPGSIHAAYRERYVRINPDLPNSDEDESDDETMEGWHF